VQSYAALDAPEILRSNLSATLSRERCLANMSKPVPNPTAGTAPLELHVLVIPPPIFEGQNLEQEFSAFV